MSLSSNHYTPRLPTSLSIEGSPMSAFGTKQTRINDSRFELKLSRAPRAELYLGGINQVDKQMVPVDFNSSFGV